MPLVTEDAKGLDSRRSRNAWVPWTVVAAVSAALWLIVASVVSSSHPSANVAPVTPVELAQQATGAALSAVQDAENRGNWVEAVKLLEAIDPKAPMETMQKHQYFQTAAPAFLKVGDPERSAALYARLLEFSTQAMGADRSCQNCHGASAPAQRMRPRMENSDAAKQYPLKLKAAGKLESTRAQLRARLDKAPNDLGAILRLYAIEKNLNHTGEADRLASRLATLDTAP